LSQPKVSVIIPVYNGEKFLEEAIKSVFNQNYDNLECIVVDDGSQDQTSSIVRRFGQVVYVYQDNAGVAAARNRGVKKSSGEYLAFLDADDVWDIKKLATQISYMEENPGIGYSFTKRKLFLDEGLDEFPAWVRIHRLEQEMTAYIPSSLVVRRPVFEAVGYFDENYRVADDSDWFIRAKDAGIKLGIVGMTLLNKRVHSRCLSSNIELSKKELLKMFKASLLRSKSADRIRVIIPVYNGE